MNKINYRLKISSEFREKMIYKRNIFFDRSGKLAWKIFRSVLIIGLSFVILYPIIIKFSTSVKSFSDIYDPAVFIIPKSLTLHNFQRVMDYIDYWKTLINTFAFTTVCSVFQTASCTMVAYGLARFKFKGKGIIFALVLLTLIVPAQTILMPLYLQFKSFSLASLLSIVPQNGGIPLLNTYWPFIMMSLTAMGIKNGLFIYMLRQYFMGMPVILEEAAYIDGCGPFRTFVKIMLPGAIPMFITIFLFSFVWLWNDYFYTAFLAPSMKIMSISIVSIGQKINNVDRDPFNQVTTMMYNNAAMVLHMVPVILIYTFTQRYFIQSIEKSGIVG